MLLLHLYAGVIVSCAIMLQSCKQQWTLPACYYIPPVSITSDTENTCSFNDIIALFCFVILYQECFSNAHILGIFWEICPNLLLLQNSRMLKWQPR